ncbi:MAG TPA: AmmeMemoRadiSam system protein A [Kofleriaceae bacterium]|nr:AmmeMemoRadiSam system protein A [Kofleriaceae bacterium]
MEYDHALADDEKRELLRIARATLREHLDTGRIPPGKPHRPTLLAPAAVFVTLHRDDALRGCIGLVEARTPIYRAVQEMAVAAATRDPRFPPVTDEELDLLEVEISVLSHARPVRGPDELTVGVHGLVVEAFGRRGLLLPQVATEAGWDAATLLARTCVKAGLPPDTWQRPDARLTAFEAQVFSDRTHPKLA